MDLLERESELSSLHQLLRDAAAGNGSLVLLAGEAGVGKTVLVRQFCREVQKNARVLIGACDPLSTPRPLGPLADIAATTGGEIERLIQSETSRTHIFSACLRELSGAWRPTVTVFEDVHWADEATLDLLRFLGRRIESCRTLVIATYRDDEVGPNHPLRRVIGDLVTAGGVHRVTVPRLSINAVGELARGSEVDPVALYRQTDGNPFFVTEVLSAGGGIPETVKDAVMARASRLSPASRLALEVCAVIGPSTSASLLDGITSLDLDTIEECLASGMLQMDDQDLAFRHELSRAAVYEAIWPPRRVELHARVLKAYESAPSEFRDLARLAHHAEAAGDRAAVLKYAPAAARRALGLRAMREAVAQYERALRFGDRLPDDQRLSLLEGYADASDLSGRGENGIALREEMIALARKTGDPLKEAEHLGWLGITLSFNWRLEETEEAARAAIAAIEGLPEGRKHVTIYMLQAYIRLEHRDFAGAIAWCERAIALADRLGDDEGSIQTLLTLGNARLFSGDIEGGRADLERCLHMAREAELDGIVAGTLTHLGFGLADFYLFTDAERFLTEAIAFSADSERGIDTYESFATTWLGMTRFYQGRWIEAETLAESVLHSPTLSKALSVGGISTALLTLGRIQARRGDPQAGLTFDEVSALNCDSDRFQSVAPVRVARAEAAWLAGDRERTIAEASVAYDLSLRDHHRWHIGENAFWLWRTGVLTEPPAEAAEPFALQIAGDWQGAAAAWAALGCPYEEARALADADDEAALRRSLATFDCLGARPMAAFVTKRLQDLGVARIPRGPRLQTRNNPAGLTDRQAAILALMAEGLRNAEIADRLYISPKTVEHHVSAIFAKLGVTSRAAATRIATELGMTT
jgi:DNA-binding CsgD family transcriptional regulator/tetratricopeptide (TPR) repeat protein